jgi:glycosidase
MRNQNKALRVFCGLPKPVGRISSGLILAAGMVFAGALASAATAPPQGPAPAESFRSRPPEDEVIYFVLPDRFANGDTSNDRGGLKGDRLTTGYDPTSRGFYNGGDLKGLTGRLDYIQGLGATTIWLGPIFRNKPVQGPPGQESAGYHGYWITDFTDVDPHFGTRADLKALVDAAHARGMKVYLDIVANHTADVIKYKECPKNDCAYRSKADYPYTRQGGVGGVAINEGFEGDDPAHQTEANFARLTSPNYAYTPYVPKGEEHAKTPDWLNNPIYYHNRGDSLYRGESSTHGDFSGLDDLFTEHPRVIQGFIDIFGQWIDDFGIDGYRIDTARHVNQAFWRAFIPAMQARAQAKGIPNFHIFGEVYDPDPAVLASFTRTGGYPAVLDFATQSVVTDVVAKGQPTGRLERLFASDVNYRDGEETARRLPTFIGNHDMGRFAFFVRQANPSASDDEVLKRVTLGHAMIYFLRGQPVIYYGDEQGFAGTGGDQASRQSLFASKVAEFNATPLVGTTATTATDNFNPSHPLYRALAQMGALRAAEPALRRGDQRVRLSQDQSGLFAVSRHAAGSASEVLIVFNTSKSPATARIEVDASSTAWHGLHGNCAPTSDAPASYSVSVPALDYIICSTVTVK